MLLGFRIDFVASKKGKVDVQRRFRTQKTISGSENLVVS